MLTEAAIKALSQFDQAYWDGERTTLADTLLPYWQDAGEESMFAAGEAFGITSGQAAAAIEAWAKANAPSVAEEITNTTKDAVERIITSWQDGEGDVSDLEDALGVWLGPTRAARIAAFEERRAEQQGYMMAHEASFHAGIGSGVVRFQAGPGACKICTTRDGDEVEIADAYGVIPVHGACGCGFVSVV